jgi:ATP-dependent helicase/nuclease subunit B
VLADDLLRAAQQGVAEAAPALVVWWFPSGPSSAGSLLARVKRLLVVAHPQVHLGPFSGGLARHDETNDGAFDDGAFDDGAFETNKFVDPVVDSAPARAGRSVRVIEVSDQRSEALEAVRAALHSDASIGRVALTSPRPELLALMREVCDHAAVAWAGPSGFSLADTIAGRCVLAMAQLERELPVDAVVGVWASGAMCRSDGALMDVATWSHLCRSAGVGRSLESWRRRLGALAHARESALPDDAGPSIARLVLDDVVRLAGMRPAPSHSWSRWATWATGVMELLIGPELERWRTADASVALDDAWKARRASEVEAYDSIRSALAQWATLDDGVVPLNHMVGALRGILRESWRRRGGVGETLLIASIDALAGADLARVVIAGVDDDSLPARLNESAVLAAIDRPATAAELAQRRAAHMAAWTTLTALTPEVVVLRSRRIGDADTHPSSVLASWDATVEYVDSPLAQAFGIATGEVGAVSKHEVAQAQWIVSPVPSAVDSRLLAAALSRTDPEVDEFNGVVAPVDLDVEWSPTTLENWAHCPRRSLFTRVLGLRAELAPGADDSIDPRERGTIVHDTLEHLVATFGNEAGTQPWSGEARVDAHRKMDALCDQAMWQGLAVDGAPWRHERAVLHRELDVTLDQDDQWRADGWVPVMAEASFGLGRQNRPSDLPAVVLPTASGEVVRIAGRIDRIDRHVVTGALMATDYKTGAKESEKSVASGLASGLKLQLPLYAMAARGLTTDDVAAIGRYWFISTRGEWLSSQMPLSDDVRATTTAVVAAIADEMAAGHFPGAARKLVVGGDACSGCDFVDVCPKDRYRQWRMTVDEPQMATLRQLSGEDSVSDGSSDE